MHPPNVFGAFGDFLNDVVNIATPIAALFPPSGGSSAPQAAAPVQAVAPMQSSDSGVLIVAAIAALLLVR